MACLLNVAIYASLGAIQLGILRPIAKKAVSSLPTGLRGFPIKKLLPSVE